VFIERLAGPDAYQTPDGPRPFTIRTESIAVRGREAPEVLPVRESRHGPVSSALDGGDAAADTVLAVAMANLAPGDSSAAGLIALNRATSLAEARAAAALITSPPQNLMVADASGAIGMYLTGRTPLRRAGDGTRPARGWDGSQDWLGFVPFDAMPHVENPASGMLAAANSRPAPPGHPVFLGRDWYGDWRLRRIGELLAATPRHTAAGFAAMQADHVSLLARDALPALRAVTPSAAAARAHRLLAGWDGGMGADRPEPLLFHSWMRLFQRAALAQAGLEEGRETMRPELLALLLDPDRGRAWCGPEGCGALLTASLDAAVAELAERRGADPTAWRWGAVHVARFEHPLLRFIPGIGALLRLEVPTDGDGETLARGGMRPGDILSRIFEKPLAIMSTSSYRANAGTEQGHLDIAKYITMPKGELAGRVLLVDDLADSGVTLKAVSIAMGIELRESFVIASSFSSIELDGGCPEAILLLITSTSLKWL
jgi:penicillin amidase